MSIISIWRVFVCVCFLNINGAHSVNELSAVTIIHAHNSDFIILSGMFQWIQVQMETVDGDGDQQQQMQ